MKRKPRSKSRIQSNLNYHKRLRTSAFSYDNNYSSLEKPKSFLSWAVWSFIGDVIWMYKPSN